MPRLDLETGSCCRSVGETMVALFSTVRFHHCVVSVWETMCVFTLCSLCVGDNGRAFDKYSTETKSIHHRHPDRVWLWCFKWSDHEDDFINMRETLSIKRWNQFFPLFDIFWWKHPQLLVPRDTPFHWFFSFLFTYPQIFVYLLYHRSLGALRAPTSSLRPFGPPFGPLGLLYFVLRALRALRPCDPRSGDWIVC